MVSRDPRIKELNGQVTLAILQAEHLPPGSAEARQAFAEVSRIEEAIAHILPVTELEGWIGRTGAIRAASSAGDDARIALLLSRYLEDPLLSEAQRAELLAWKWYMRSAERAKLRG